MKQKVKKMYLDEAKMKFMKLALPTKVLTYSLNVITTLYRIELK